MEVVSRADSLSGLRPWTLPILCVAMALIEGALYASGPFGVYRAGGVLSGIGLLRFLSPLAVDILSLGALLALLPWRHWSGALLGYGLVTLLVTVHFLQYIAVEVSGEFLSVVALRFADHAGYLLTRRLLVSLALTLLACGAAIVFLRWSLRVESWSAPLRQRVTVALLCAGLVVALSWNDFEGERQDLLERHGIEFGSPVAALWRVAGAAVASAPEPRTTLSRAAIEQARLRGIRIEPEHYTPFARETVYRAPLPFGERTSLSRPNLIVLFIESFSAAVLPAYGAPHAGLTPNIDDFAGKSMRVDQYLNHTTPTILGLRGQLCSNYPRLQHFAWERSLRKPETGKLLCMPELLAREGYETRYLSHAPADEAYMESQFLDLGFRATHFKESIMAEFLPDEEPDRVLQGQPGDLQMFKILVRYLEARESDAPLFLALSTIETHLASEVSGSEGRYQDGRSPVLDVFHQLDRGFGIFWRWFEHSAYADNTILVLTGDHVMLPHDALRRVAGPAFRNHRFDYMGLFIRDPTHELPKSYRAGTTSIDLAPSLLQLLGVKHHPNAFLGLSMFSDRRQVRPGFAFAWGNDMTDWNAEGGLFTITKRECDKRLDLVEELAASGKRPAQACLMYQVLDFAHHMEATNRMWATPR